MCKSRLHIAVCLCAVCQQSFVQALVGFLFYETHFLSAGDACDAGDSCSCCSFCCLRSSLSTWAIVGIFLLYLQIFAVSSSIVVLTLTSPRPPSLCLTYLVQWNFIHTVVVENPNNQMTTKLLVIVRRKNF